MRDAWSERAADVLPAVLSVVIGAIVVAAAAGDPGLLRIPLGAWIAVFAVFVVALVGITVAAERLPVALLYSSFAVACLSAIVVVASAPLVGWITIVFVFVALASGYLVPLWASVLLVAVNSAVLVVSMLAAGLELGGALITTAIYAVLQANGVLFVRILLRERGLRADVEAANVELRAARLLLEERTRETERLRISRDLHDVLGHQLTALALELETALHAEPAQARGSVERARAVAGELLGDVRATVGELRTADADLERSLRSIVSGVRHPRIELRVDDLPELDRDVTDVVVHAVQEAVTNAIRHARAEVLRVTVRGGADGGLVVEAHDDGDGDPQPVPGNGLTGMRERVEHLGGSLDVDGANGGFRLVARIPGVTS